MTLFGHFRALGFFLAEGTVRTHMEFCDSDEKVERIQP